jgi:hypothetical protein
MLAVAARSFFGTMLLMAGVGVVLAAGVYHFLAELSPLVGVIGAALALAEAGAVGLIWAGKRAVVRALLYGIRRGRLGSAAVDLVFDRVLGVAVVQAAGGRTGAVARAIERVPLAQAEARVKSAVEDLLAGSSERGGLTGFAAGRLRSRLLRSVEVYTLARFRERDQAEGGVNLAAVRDDLAGRIDGALERRLTQTLNLWTVLVLVGLPAQVFATVYVVLALLK